MNLTDLKYSKIDVIASDLENNSVAAPAATKDIATALEEAQELAHAAFELSDPDAIAYTEKLLYQIHVASNFAPPTSALAGIIWSTLITKKLDRCLSAQDVGDELTAQDMREQLEHEVAVVDERDHSVLDDFLAQEANDALILYAKNWYGSTHGFTTQLISLAQRCNGKAHMQGAFLELIENIQDEFTDIPHPELRKRWPDAIGVSFSVAGALVDDDQLTEAFSVQNFRTGVCCLADPTFGLGSFYSIEAVFPGVCKRMYSGLKHRGFEDDSIVTFKLHAGVDEDHAAHFLDALIKSDFSGHDRAKIVAGARAQLSVRSDLFSAMRERANTRQRMAV